MYCDIVVSDAWNEAWSDELERGGNVARDQPWLVESLNDDGSVFFFFLNPAEQRRVIFLFLFSYFLLRVVCVGIFSVCVCNSNRA